MFAKQIDRLDLVHIFWSTWILYLNMIITLPSICAVVVFFLCVLLYCPKSYPTFPNCWLTLSPTPRGHFLFSEVTLILRYSQEALMTMEGEIFLSPPGQLYSCVAGRLSLALCMCECQTGGHWGGDMRIGEKLLAKAVLEVPLVWFSICSRRVETQWGEMLCWMQIDWAWWNI